LHAVLAIFLADGILGAWRSAWLNTDWRAPLKRAETLPPTPLPLLPYAAPHSPGARLALYLGTRITLWREAIWPEVGDAIVAILISGLLALALGLVLGLIPVLFTLLALIVSALESERTRGADWARAASEIGLVWLIGHTALNNLSVASLGLACLFTVAYYGALGVTREHPRGLLWVNLAQIGVIIALVVWRLPVAAGLIALMLVAQGLWQAVYREKATSSVEYLRHVQTYVLAGMLVAALAVAL
jgi:hypothetical protein